MVVLSALHLAMDAIGAERSTLYILVGPQEPP